MSKKFGKAGKGAREMAFRRELVVAGIAGVMLLLIWVWTANMAAITKIGLPGVILLVVAFKMVMTSLEKKGKRVKKRVMDAERGARAEEVMEAKLADLPGDYTVFHDLAFPGFNVDHVAVGPGGVFVIETKSHGGKITNTGDQLLLNSHRPDKDFINQTWAQTYHIGNLLQDRLGQTVPITPVLCFTNAFVQVRGKVKGITVINGGHLNAFIARQKPVLPADRIVQIVACLKMATKAEEPDKRLCPRCNAELVLRQLRSGVQAGEFFYGCPACRQRWPVEVLPATTTVATTPDVARASWF